MHIATWRNSVLQVAPANESASNSCLLCKGTCKYKSFVKKLIKANTLNFRIIVLNNNNNNRILDYETIIIFYSNISKFCSNVALINKS